MRNICIALMSLIVGCGLLVSPGHAQIWDKWFGHHGHHDPNSSDAALQKDAVIEKAPPGPERSEPQLPEVPAGMFVAPPRSGEVVGPQRSIGIPTLTFTLPELSISTPRLAITGFHSTRREPHVRLDANVAPYAANPDYVRALMLREAELRALEQQQQERAGEPGAKQRSEDLPVCPLPKPEMSQREDAESQRIRALEQQVSILLNEIQRLHTTLASQSAAASPAIQPIAEANGEFPATFLEDEVPHRSIYAAEPFAKEYAETAFRLSEDQPADHTQRR